MSTKPFTDVEIITALGIKLAELRGEMKDLEIRLRSEISKVRAEISSTEHGKRRSSVPAVRDPVGINRAH